LPAALRRRRGISLLRKRACAIGGVVAGGVTATAFAEWEENRLEATSIADVSTCQSSVRAAAERIRRATSGCAPGDAA